MEHERRDFSDCAREAVLTCTYPLEGNGPGDASEVSASVPLSANPDIAVVRRIDVASTVYLRLGLRLLGKYDPGSGIQVPVDATRTAIMELGADVALAAYPASRATSYAVLEINGTEFFQPYGDALLDALRVSDCGSLRAGAVCPTALDTLGLVSATAPWASSAYSDAGGSNVASSRPGNGSFPGVWWVDEHNAPLSEAPDFAPPVDGDGFPTGTGVWRGCPTWGSGIYTPTTSTFWVRIGFKTVEPLWVSPASPALSSASQSQEDVLRGVSSLKVRLGRGDPARALRILTAGVQSALPTLGNTCALVSVGYSAPTPYGDGRPCRATRSAIVVRTVTLRDGASRGWPRAACSLVPHRVWRSWEFPATSLCRGMPGDVVLFPHTPRVVMTALPSLLLLSVAPPASALSADEGDWLFSFCDPLPDRARPAPPCTVSVGNSPVMLTHASAEELFATSSANAASPLDWALWSGKVLGSSPASWGRFLPWVQTVGGAIMLAMGRDVPLPDGVTPGTVGAFDVGVGACAFRTGTSPAPAMRPRLIVTAMFESTMTLTPGSAASQPWMRPWKRARID